MTATSMILRHWFTTSAGWLLSHAANRLTPFIETYILLPELEDEKSAQ